MTILAGDIRIMKSEVMLDVSDGGGRITANEVVDGVSNNMFPDISELDRTYGRASLRKVFPLVNTSNVDTYLGGHVILTKPPADPKVSVLLFSTQNWTDQRSAAQSRIESYLARGPYLNGQVLGVQLTGQRSVAMLFKLGRSYPDVGDTIILTQNEGLITEFSQYVRTSKRVVTKQTYTVLVGGSTISFDANQVVYDITDALRYDFNGPDPLYIDARSTAYAQARSTVVANAATYYGIQKVTEDVTTGDLTCKVAGLFSSIVPSTTTEVAILDQSAIGAVPGLIPAGAPGNTDVDTTSTAVGPSQGLQHRGAVHPGSWSMVAGATTLVDDGGQIKNGTTQVGNIDYTTGTVSFLPSAPTYSGTKTITYLPAAQLPSATQSHGVTVTTGNRGYVWTYTFDEPITRGGVTVSYRAQGKWYTLYDNAGGKLDGGDPTLGTGTINYGTGSLSVTLGALPDVGGEIIFTSTQTTSGYSPVATTSQTVVPYVEWDVSPGTTKGIAVTTLSISWTSGGAKTATDDGEGNIIGDATGTVNYATGIVRMVPNSWPATGTTISWSCTGVDVSGRTIGSVVLASHMGGWQATLGVTSIKPGSVKILVPVNRSTVVSPYQLSLSDGAPISSSSYWKVGSSPPSIILQSDASPGAGYGLSSLDDVIWIVATDDGIGGFVYYSVPLAGWSINYTTGVVTATGPSVDVYWEGWNTATYQLGIHLKTGVIVANGGDLGFEALGSPATAGLSGSFNLTSITIPVDGLGLLDGVLPSSLRISWGVGTNFFAQGGEWRTGHNPITGGSTVVGSFDISTGRVQATQWPTGVHSCTVTSYAVASSRLKTAWSVFRIPGAPVTVGSLQLRVDFPDELMTVYLPELNGLGTHAETISARGADYQQYTVVADTVHADIDTNGNITTPHVTPAPGAILVYPAVTGTCNFVTGVVRVTTTLRVAGYTVPQLAAVTGAHPSLVNADDELEFAYAIDQSAMVYNAVTLKYLPLDALLLGLDPVRLPSDGRVPVFQPGMVGVLHNTQITNFGAGAHGSPVGSGASATAVLTGDAVTGVTSLVGGTAYDQNCPLTFTGGSGTGAAGYGVQTAGVITSVVITNGGSGYLTPPTIAFVPTGTKLSLGRSRIAAIKLYDSAATPVDVNIGDYSADLDAGTVTLLPAYDPGDYTLPIRVEHRIEDMALISDAEITGDIEFTRQISHDYPANTSYLSSALIMGDQQARVTSVFDQVSFTGVYSDTQIGANATGTFNKITYPITVLNKDTIQERWVIIFTDSNNFRVVGESVGQIATGNITTNLNPNNPNTGAPYFTLDYRGWGGGWVAGNCLRFNTVAANYPVWVVRTVQQGSPGAASDNFQMQVRGDIDA